MKGKILGADGTGGAISGDDGERYNFAIGAWKGEGTPAPGTAVDFDVRDGQAVDLYPVAKAARGAPQIDLSGVAASPAVARIKTLAMTTLAFPLAVLLLLATLLPAISSPIASANLWGLGKVAAMMSANPLLANDDSSYATERLQKIDEEEAQIRAQLTAAGVPVPSDLATLRAEPFSPAAQLKDLATERERLTKQAAKAGWASTVNSLLVLRFLVPLGAAALIWLAWAGKPVARPSIVVGAIAIVVFLLVYMFRNALVGDPGDETLGGVMAQQMDAAISVGFGAYVIALCGIGLVLAGLGTVRNPLAAKV